MGAPKPRPPRSTPSNYDKGGKGVQILERPPPFFGNWPKDTIGMGTKKKDHKKKGWEGVTIRKKTAHSTVFHFSEQYFKTEISQKCSIE